MLSQQDDEGPAQMGHNSGSAPANTAKDNTDPGPDRDFRLALEIPDDVPAADVRRFEAAIAMQGKRDIRLNAIDVACSRMRPSVPGTAFKLLHAVCQFSKMEKRCLFLSFDEIQVHAGYADRSQVSVNLDLLEKAGHVVTLRFKVAGNRWRVFIAPAVIPADRLPQAITNIIMSRREVADANRAKGNEKDRERRAKAAKAFAEAGAVVSPTTASHAGAVVSQSTAPLSPKQRPVVSPTTEAVVSPTTLYQNSISDLRAEGMAEAPAGPSVQADARDEGEGVAEGTAAESATPAGSTAAESVRPSRQVALARAQETPPPIPAPATAGTAVSARPVLTLGAAASYDDIEVSPEAARKVMAGARLSLTGVPSDVVDALERETIAVMEKCARQWMGLHEDAEKGDKDAAKKIKANRTVMGWWKSSWQSNHERTLHKRLPELMAEHAERAEMTPPAGAHGMVKPLDMAALLKEAMPRRFQTVKPTLYGERDSVTSPDFKRVMPSTANDIIRKAWEMSSKRIALGRPDMEDICPTFTDREPGWQDRLADAILERAVRAAMVTEPPADLLPKLVGQGTFSEAQLKRLVETCFRDPGFVGLSWRKYDPHQTPQEIAQRLVEGMPRLHARWLEDHPREADRALGSEMRRASRIELVDGYALNDAFLTLYNVPVHFEEQTEFCEGIGDATVSEHVVLLREVRKHAAETGLPLMEALAAVVNRYGRAKRGEHWKTYTPQLQPVAIKTVWAWKPGEFLPRKKINRHIPGSPEYNAEMRKFFGLTGPGSAA